MAYVQVHQSLVNHRKALRLVEILQMDHSMVIGKLVMLWMWCLDNALTGSLTDVGPAMVARVMEFEGDPEKLCDALFEAGFLDRDEGGECRVHDWDEYMGSLIDRREANAARMRRARAEARAAREATDGEERAQHVRRTSRTRVGARGEKSKAKKSREEERESRAEQSRSVEAGCAHTQRSLARDQIQESDGISEHDRRTVERTPEYEELWKACVDAMDGPPSTKAERGRWERGVADLLESGATPKEVYLRARCAKDSYSPGVPIHPITLARNWGALGNEVSRGNYEEYYSEG